MNNEMRSADSFGQPWWRVRPQLIAVLVLLMTICIALWTDTPVRKWMVQQVVQAEIPNLQLFAQANH